MDFGVQSSLRVRSMTFLLCSEMESLRLMMGHQWLPLRTIALPFPLLTIRNTNERWLSILHTDVLQFD